MGDYGVRRLSRLQQTALDLELPLPDMSGAIHYASVRPIATRDGSHRDVAKNRGRFLPTLSAGMHWWQLLAR